MDAPARRGFEADPLKGHAAVATQPRERSRVADDRALRGGLGHGLRRRGLHVRHEYRRGQESEAGERLHRYKPLKDFASQIRFFGSAMQFRRVRENRFGVDASVAKAARWLRAPPQRPWPLPSPPPGSPSSRAWTR